MATVVAGMTTSLDGFVDDPGGSASRLYPDLAALRGTAYMSRHRGDRRRRNGEEDVRDGGP